MRTPAKLLKLCARGTSSASGVSGMTLLALSETASPRGLDHEYIARLHFHLKGCAEFFPCPVGALHPVAPDSARLPARDAERCDPPMVGEHHGGHRLEEAHAPLAAVAAAMTSGAAAATSD